MKTKPFYIDMHVIQTVPPSNINRDDTGSPKTARFGGVVRARVSSQAWKSAIRKEFRSMLDTDDLGLRTKYVVDSIAKRIHSERLDISEDDAIKLASNVLGATGVKVEKKKDTDKSGKTGYLVFISPQQIVKLAELALRSDDEGKKISNKEAKAILDVKKNPALNSIDIALFGRMVTDAPELNVDASVQVAHALGVGKASQEFDYFTAMDDCSPKDNAGAGMISTTEFMSSTLYRYATIDIAHLNQNLGSTDAAMRAIQAFIKAFITSMPSGKQNSFANRTLPSAVVVQLRSTQPVSLVNAFEKPIRATNNENELSLTCDALIHQEKMLDEAFGVEPDKTFVICAAPGAEGLSSLATDQKSSNMDAVLNNVNECVKDYFDQSSIDGE